MELEYEDYTPAFNGNREADIPFTVEIKPLTRGDIEAYSDRIHSEPVKGFRNRTKNNAGAVQHKQFIQNIGNVKNFSHPRLGTPITTAKELYEAPGLNSLITELIEAMEDDTTLSEGLVKN